MRLPVLRGAAVVALVASLSSPAALAQVGARRGRVRGPPAAAGAGRRAVGGDDRVVRGRLAPAAGAAVGASARRPAARLLPAERDARPAHRRRRQELRHRVRAGSSRRVERALPVPGRGRPERHGGAAARTDGAGRRRARPRLRRRHHRHRPPRGGLRRVLHGGAAGEPRLRLPGGRARGRAREADPRAALRPARRARVLHGLLDRRARGHADGAAPSHLLRRHRRRRAGDAHALLRDRGRVGRDDAEPGGAARRVGKAGRAPRASRTPTGRR